MTQAVWTVWKSVVLYVQELTIKNLVSESCHNYENSADL